MTRKKERMEGRKGKKERKEKGKKEKRKLVSWLYVIMKIKFSSPKNQTVMCLTQCQQSQKASKKHVSTWTSHGHKAMGKANSSFW